MEIKQSKGYIHPMFIHSLILYTYCGCNPFIVRLTNKPLHVNQISTFYDTNINKLVDNTGIAANMTEDATVPSVWIFVDHSPI